jgi:DNA-binding GntR family transcriptional regulator
LTEEAYDHVRLGILNGSYPLGSVVSEGAVAEALGISKTPVREALQMLRREALLEAGPRRQQVVRGFSPAHREEILEVREAMERIAIAHACSAMTIDDIDYLRLLLIKQQRAVDNGLNDELAALDEEFHVKIAEGANLAIVARILSQLRGFVRIMRLGHPVTRSHLRNVVADHQRIVDAIERHDVEGALEALTEHLRRFDKLPAVRV